MKVGAIFLKNEAKKEFIYNILYLLAIGVLFFIAVKLMLSYLLPFFIALIVAIAVQKPSGCIANKLKIKSGVVSAFLASALYIIIAVILVFLIYRIYLFIGDIMNNIPFFSSRINLIFSAVNKKLTLLVSQFSPELSAQIGGFTKDILSSFTAKFSVFVSSFAGGIAKKTPSFIFSSIVTLVASCFIAKDFNGLKKFSSALLGKKIYGNIIKIKAILSTTVLKLIKGYLILMLVTFIELSFGFLIIGIKYPLLLAFLMAIIDALPVLGTGAVLIPWGVIDIILGNTSLGISILIIYALITLIRNFAEPKIIGNQIGIHPLFTLLAMFVGIKIFGLAGIFIMPITLIVVIRYYKAEMENEQFKT